MADIKASINSKGFQRFLNRLLSSIPGQALMNRLGLMAIHYVKDRTRKGVFLEQSSGADEYSEGYKKLRERRGLPTHPVTLTLDDVSGMMTKIDHLVSADFTKVLVYINDPKKRTIARYHNTMGAGKSRVIRKFMGLNAEEEAQLQTLASRNIRTILRGL